MTNWDERFVKIWTLFDAGGDHRIQAVVLLDALVDIAVDAGEGHRLSKIFDGIRITSDGLTIPNFIREDLSAISINRWNRTPLANAMKDCRLLEIYELYFRVYPEKIQELQGFICLEACTHVPSFCGPDSPVRALGLLPPFYDLRGINISPTLKGSTFILMCQHLSDTLDCVVLYVSLISAQAMV